MKVNPRHILSHWKKGVLHALLMLLVLTTGACDFDIPDKFEMPTWYLDLKIPLVQTRYQMSDISDSTSGIFLTDDSLGFKIIQEGNMPATELPGLPSVPIGLEQAISSGEIPGISMDIELPGISIDQRIDVVLYGASIYQDTAKWCELVTLYDTTVFPPAPFDSLICLVDSSTGDTLGRLFSFPTDSVRHMTSANYNSLIVALFDSVMGILSSALDTTIDLGLSSIPLPEDPPIIASIDTLIIGAHPSNSVYRTLFKNNGIPTDLQNVYSHMVTGNSNLFLSDTLANHGDMPTISNGQTYADTTDISGKGLTSFLKLATNMSLTPANDYVTISPGSLYVDFKLAFQMAGIDSIDVTTNNYSMSDGIEMPPMELPEMDMTESGISRMEIYRNILKDQGSAFNENKLLIGNLESSFPFDMNFLMNFKNFSPTPGNDSVKIDTVLKKGITIDRTFDMRGYSLQSIDGDNDGDGWPDSAFSSFDLVLDITIPEQKASIPLDGSPLGEFTMNMQLDQLSFSSIGANLYMEMPAEPTEQEFPPGFTGAIPTEAMIEIIFKNQIRLPIEMLMEFKGYNSLGELTYVPVVIDTIGFPSTSSDLDTAKTVIALNKLGTTITIYASVEDTVPSFTKTIAPCDTCATIIDLLASNPVQMIINPEVKVDGRGEISADKAIAGGFRVTIPFVLQMEPMTFMGGTATEIEEFEHETRYKIRNSLLETSLVSTITNALPFGAEVSVLLSNDSQFPTDTSRDQLNFFRDTLAAQGILPLTDSLYIIRECGDISPDSSNIYIYDIMTDHSECIDGLPYIIRSDGSGTDTIYSYVDTLFKFLLPDPESYYGENDSTGYPEGMVAVPGTGVYPSTIDTSKIFLLTDYGSHYTMPRFYLPGTGNTGVFISVEDYLDISSFITFTLSSSGAFGSAKNELIMLYPNGGQTLYTNESYEINWASYGTSSEAVDLYYSTGGDTNTYKPGYCVYTDNWTLIEGGLDNSGSYDWDLSSSGLAETDSLRLKIIASNGESCDINGHYVKIRNSSNTAGHTPLRSKISWGNR